MTPAHWAAVLVAAVFCAIYLPDVGHGFVKDDVEWIAHSRIDRPTDTSVLVKAPSGFFRPMVSLSFAVNRWFCNLTPFGYGLTNLVLALACAVAVGLLARALDLSAGAAVLASAIWLFNWHGINMAVLWISGRTALLLTLFSVLAATAFARRRVWWALAMTAAAMFSKEEAILLPLVLTGWFLIERWRRKPHRDLFLRLYVVSAAGVELAYFWLRIGSGAFTPLRAPSYYHLSFSVARLAANVPGYFDRSVTFSLVVFVAFLLVVRTRVAVGRDVGPRVLAFAVCWWVGTLALTVFLPVRSSLYACLPSVAASVAVAMLVGNAWPRICPAAAHRCIAAAVAGVLILWPVYHLRNRPSVREADLSAHTIETLRQVAGEHRSGVVVMLYDDRRAKPSLESSFGTLMQDAVDLLVIPPPRVWIEPPPSDAVLAGLSRPSHVDVVLRLQRGTLRSTR